MHNPPAVLVAPVAAFEMNEHPEKETALEALTKAPHPPVPVPLIKDKPSKLTVPVATFFTYTTLLTFSPSKVHFDVTSEQVMVTALYTQIENVVSLLQIPVKVDPVFSATAPPALVAS